MNSLRQLAGPVGRHAPGRAVSALLALLAGCAVMVGGMASVHAGNLQVSPISLEFAPREQAQGIWLSNSGTTPLRAQVRVQQWSQPEGLDQLSPTRELAASPPAVEIAPGAKQLIRIIRQQTAAPAQEQAFRLIVDELPAATGAVADSAAQPGLQFLLRYSVPVFVSMAEPVQANGKPSDISGLSGALAPTWPDAKTATLTAQNAGAKRLKLSQLVFVAADGRRTVLVPGLLGYVLAGQRMQWPVDLSSLQGSPAGGSLKAKFNADLDEQTLPLVITRP